MEEGNTVNETEQVHRLLGLIEWDRIRGLIDRSDATGAKWFARGELSVDDVRALLDLVPRVWGEGYAAGQDSMAVPIGYDDDRATLESVFEPFIKRTKLFGPMSEPNNNALVHGLLDAILAAGFSRPEPRAAHDRLATDLGHELP